LLGAITATSLSTKAAEGAPKVVVISLDGATPRLVDKYLQGSNRGLDVLRARGFSATRNVTITPSLTAASHIAIATGSTAARNNINANSFHLVATPFLINPDSGAVTVPAVSGFGAPIGGYSLLDVGATESASPTALPIWSVLRAATPPRKVVTATWPGGDGVDVTVPGIPTALVQSASKRTVDYTVPFGAFAGVGGKGYSFGTGGIALTVLTSAANDAGVDVSQQLAPFGVTARGDIYTAPLEVLTIGGRTYDMRLLAIDTTNDGAVNLDTVIVYDANVGVLPGPFALPRTGASVLRKGQASRPFFFDGSANNAGLHFYVSRLDADPSAPGFELHLNRTSAYTIPSTAAVAADVTDILTNVGFWAPQPDFRITQRQNPGNERFTDAELEEIYNDLIPTFVNYQTKVALRGMARIPDADLVMMYIEQPDGSAHQYLIADDRQATDPRNPSSIGAGQDAAKRTRYDGYVRLAYETANNGVQQVIDAIGVDGQGRPNGNIIVVSDHGFDPFHTTVDITRALPRATFPANAIKSQVSGPAVNIYINLQGRQPNGLVPAGEFAMWQDRIEAALRALVDTNSNYVPGPTPVFDKIYRRPTPGDAGAGLGTDEFVGQDTGDVFAILKVGYNFDGLQFPAVARLGDPTVDGGSAPTSALSIPSFYGAHGYDPTIPNMSAIMYAAGPDIRQGTIAEVHNIDIAPTILSLLNVPAPPTMQGSIVPLRAAVDAGTPVDAQADVVTDGSVADTAVATRDASVDAYVVDRVPCDAGSDVAVLADASLVDSSASKDASGDAGVADAAKVDGGGDTGGVIGCACRTAGATPSSGRSALALSALASLVVAMRARRRSRMA